MGQIHTTTKPTLGQANWDTYGTALDADLRNVGVRTVTAATTIVNTDEYVRVNSAGAVSQPIPASMPTITIMQIGAGQVTVTPGSGVTLTGRFKTASQYSAITVIPTSSTTYDVIGGVA